MPFQFLLFDTDDLSNETYDAVITEAERFHNNLSLHVGMLTDDCGTDEKRLNFDFYDFWGSRKSKVEGQ